MSDFEWPESPSGRAAGASDSVGFAEAQIQAMRDDPRLEAAMRHSVTRALAYYRANPVMHRNVKDVGRFVLGVVALYLDATGGLTHRRLRTLSGHTGLISSGAASAVLLRLRLIGYVTPEGPQVNGQVKLYRPTAIMAAAFRERMRIELEAAAAFNPRVAAVLERLEQPEVFPTLMAVMGDDTINAARNPHPHTVGLDRISTRTAGMMLMYRILSDADTGAAFPPTGELAISVSSLAREFEVSRSHVLTVLRDAEQAGLLTRLDGEGRWRLEPSLGQAFRTFYAVLYMGMIKGARATQAALAMGRAGAGAR
jgi:hypothetical protein